MTCSKLILVITKVRQRQCQANVTVRYSESEMDINVCVRPSIVSWSRQPNRCQALQSVIEPPTQCWNPDLHRIRPPSQSVSDSQSGIDSLVNVRPSARIRSPIRGIGMPAKKNRWDAIFYAGNRQWACTNFKRS